MVSDSAEVLVNFPGLRGGSSVCFWKQSSLSFLHLWTSLMPVPRRLHGEAEVGRYLPLELQGQTDFFLPEGGPRERTGHRPSWVTRPTTACGVAEDILEGDLGCWWVFFPP